MRETNPKAGATKPAGSPHDVFKAQTPQALRQVAENGAEQAKETYAKMTAAAGVASDLIQASCTTAAKGAAEYNAKVIQIARTNVNAAFDYARDISSVRSPSELVEVMSGHARKGFDVFAEQSRELTALAQKVTSDATEPLKSGIAKAFRGPLG
jgi:phasin